MASILARGAVVVLATEGSLLANAVAPDVEEHAAAKRQVARLNPRAADNLP